MILTGRLYQTRERCEGRYIIGELDEDLYWLIFSDEGFADLVGKKRCRYMAIFSQQEIVGLLPYKVRGKNVEILGLYFVKGDGKRSLDEDFEQGKYLVEAVLDTIEGDQRFENIFFARVNSEVNGDILEGILEDMAFLSFFEEKKDKILISNLEGRRILKGL